MPVPAVLVRVLVVVPVAVPVVLVPVIEPLGTFFLGFGSYTFGSYTFTAPGCFLAQPPHLMDKQSQCLRAYWILQSY